MKRLAFIGRELDPDPWIQGRISQAVHRAAARGLIYYSVETLTPAGRIAGIQLGHIRRHRSISFIAVTLDTERMADFIFFLAEENGSNGPDQFFVLPEVIGAPDPVQKLNEWQLANCDTVCFLGQDIGMYFEEIYTIQYRDEDLPDLPVLHINPINRSAGWYINGNYVRSN